MVVSYRHTKKLRALTCSDRKLNRISMTQSSLSDYLPENLGINTQAALIDELDRKERIHRGEIKEGCRSINKCVWIESNLLLFFLLKFRSGQKMILRKWIKPKIQEIQLDGLPYYKSTINIKKLFHDLSHLRAFFSVIIFSKKDWQAPALKTYLTAKHVFVFNSTINGFAASFSINLAKPIFNQRTKRGGITSDKRLSNYQ